jgi:hypothetical protein
MLKWNTLHQNLEKAANRHLLLASRFNEFAKFIEDQITHQTFHIKGITTSLHLEQGFFTTMFSGRTLHFAFSSINENGTLIGNVKCHLKKEFPEPTYIEIGEFSFTGNGQTSLIEPEDNDPITIDSDLPSLYVALHFIHESLLQPA